MLAFPGGGGFLEKDLALPLNSIPSPQLIILGQLIPQNRPLAGLKTYAGRSARDFS